MRALLIPDLPTSLLFGNAVRLSGVSKGVPIWACTLWWQGCVITRFIDQANPPTRDELITDLNARPEDWDVVRCAPAPAQP